MKIIVAILYFVSAFSLSHIHADTVYETTLLEARENAQKNHTPYVVIFEVDWASPCQWMENFTFNEKSVTDYIRSNYSAVKINIDEFEGYALKEKYKITTLPTILIFDNQNEVIGRYEQTYRSNAFVELLKWHKNYTRTQASIIGEKTPKATQNPSPRSQSSTSTQNTVKTSSVYNPCTIQIGAFGSYDNAQKMLNKNKSKFPNQAFHIYTLSGQKYPHRVTIGNFKNRDEATHLLFELDKKGVDGIVKKNSLYVN